MYNEYHNITKTKSYCATLYYIKLNCLKPLTFQGLKYASWCNIFYPRLPKLAFNAVIRRIGENKSIQDLVE